MSDFNDYINAQDKVDSAYQQHSYAVIKLEHEKIKMRLAEIKSQYEPLNELLKDMALSPEQKTVWRDKIWRAAFYVTIGRFPA